jgi:hypothetical protein
MQAPKESLGFSSKPRDVAYTFRTRPTGHSNCSASQLFVGSFPLGQASHPPCSSKVRGGAHWHSLLISENVGAHIQSPELPSDVKGGIQVHTPWSLAGLLAGRAHSPRWSIIRPPLHSQPPSLHQVPRKVPVRYTYFHSKSWEGHIHKLLDQVILPSFDHPCTCIHHFHLAYNWVVHRRIYW